MKIRKKKCWSILDVSRHDKRVQGVKFLVFFVFACFAGSCEAFISLQKKLSCNIQETRLAVSVESDVSSLNPTSMASATFSSEEWMKPILTHPSLDRLDMQKRPRKKLKSRHKAYFRDEPRSDKILEDLAIACCDSGVVPRKEFFETYAAALYIHHELLRCNVKSLNEASMGTSHCYRVADLAAGHGLLSWMLLVMDMDIYNESRDPEQERVQGKNGMISTHSRKKQRTAVCLDRRMPPSAVAIAKSMRKHFFPIADTDVNSHGDCDDANYDDSGLYDYRWTYVESDLKNVLVDDDSTLIVSVHACGTLTDYLMELGIDSKASMAIVPCCHTYSIRKGYTPHPLFSGTTAIEVAQQIEQKQMQLQTEQWETRETNSLAVPVAKKSNTKFQIVEDIIDQVRFQTLKAAGYQDVRIASLPIEFTERNRLFLARYNGGEKDVLARSTTDAMTLGNENRIKRQQISYQESSANPSIRKGSMPPRNQDSFSSIERMSSDKSTTKFVVPLKDDPSSIKQCLAAAGKVKALERLRACLPNHFSRTLDVSIWLTSERDNGDDAFEAGIDTSAILKELQNVLDETIQSFRKETKDNRSFSCNIRQIYDTFVHPQTGRVACTYQIEYAYGNVDESGIQNDSMAMIPFSKSLAKELHSRFCDSVIESIDGTEMR